MSSVQFHCPLRRSSRDMGKQKNFHALFKRRRRECYIFATMPRSILRFFGFQRRVCYARAQVKRLRVCLFRYFQMSFSLFECFVWSCVPQVHISGYISFQTKQNKTSTKSGTPRLGWCARIPPVCQNVHVQLRRNQAHSLLTGFWLAQLVHHRR